MPRFDESAKVIEVPVRELAEDTAFHRIGFERGEGWIRFGLGAELHVRVLKQRGDTDPDYQREVHVRAQVPVDDWTALITGRIDGCTRRDGRWFIEEFKSALFNEADQQPPTRSFERHRRQLLTYAHLWKRLGHEPVTAALVYVDLFTGREASFPVNYDETEQEESLQTRLREFISGWKAQQERQRQKAAAANSLPFPHAAPRPGQQKLIDTVRRAVATQQLLLAEAPTGSGKTAATLFPALAHGLSTGQQVLFLTAKTLQQKMAVSALHSMNRDGAFRTLQLRAKEKMCANDRVICHEDFCPYAKNYPEKMERSRLLDRLREHLPHFDPDRVFTEAKAEQVCPFEVQLELAGSADAIVADYNYVFEPTVALKHLAGGGLAGAVLLVDEAHNLPDRARQIFSPELRAALFRDVEGRLLLRAGEPFDGILKTVQRGLILLQDIAAKLPDGTAIAEVDPPAREVGALWAGWERNFLQYLAWKREMKVAPADDPLVDLHFALQRFVTVLNLFLRREPAQAGAGGFTCVVENLGRDIRLAVVCLDPARALGPVFRQAASVVLLSATLSPPHFFARMLGLDKDRTEFLSLPPPFPRENRKIMILPQVRTTFSAREKNFGRIASLIRDMSDAHCGNDLVLFPSYQFLSGVAARMPGARAHLILQRPNATEAARQEILRTLASPPPQGVLVFAVLGGMFAEGVDYPGELLSGVFVVSPALPQVSFERELLRRYFDQTEQAGFDYAYLLPGMTRVIQAAGRVIRSETDRGVIALVCQRFLQSPYVNYLPRDWFMETPAELIAQNPAGQIRAFFPSI